MIKTDVAARPEAKVGKAALMKAMVQDGYGPPDKVLHFRDIAIPPVGGEDVLVRVRAASVHADVWHVVTGRPWVLRLMGSGLRKPKDLVPGTDLAGVVESVGAKVTRFRPGDEVFGESLRGGMQWRNAGAFAEYASVPQNCLAHKPKGVTFEQAAVIPTSGIIALFNLGYGDLIKPVHKVLINGAGGGVGSIALQLAKACGATVTGVDRPEKADLLRSLGADHFLDYTLGDVLAGGERYDLIFDVASTLAFPDCKRALTPTGLYILIGHDHFGKVGRRAFGSLPRFFRLTVLTPFNKQLPKLDFKLPNQQKCMAVLKDLLEAGKLSPVIAQSYPLDEVTKALRHLQEGTARGRIVITP